jgi:hypothetical protein
MKEYLLNRCEQVLLSALNELSSSIFLLPLDKGDFKVGRAIPLNLNHDNPILKYIALAASKAPESATKTFIEKYAVEVMSELGVAYDEYYAKDAVSAHNAAVAFSFEMARYKAFIEVLSHLGEQHDAEVLSKWLVLNPVETGEDWS